jgi:hypothetical protein
MLARHNCEWERIGSKSNLVLRDMLQQRRRRRLAVDNDRTMLLMIDDCRGDWYDMNGFRWNCSDMVNIRTITNLERVGAERKQEIRFQQGQQWENIERAACLPSRNNGRASGQRSKRKVKIETCCCYPTKEGKDKDILPTDSGLSENF